MAVVQDTEEHAPVLTTTEARQGRRGRHVAWVLGISMILIVVGYAALWLGSAGHLASGSQPKVDSPAAARSFDGNTPQPSQR